MCRHPTDQRGGQSHGSEPWSSGGLEDECCVEVSMGTKRRGEEKWVTRGFLVGGDRYCTELCFLRQIERAESPSEPV